jgi:hypothetical protein
MVAEGLRLTRTLPPQASRRRRERRQPGPRRVVLLLRHGGAQRAGGKATYPGIVDDYRSTFAKAKAMRPDVLLDSHPEVCGMQEKRARMKDGAPNPFVKPGELATYLAGLETDFDKQLAKQMAAMKAN